MVSSYTPVRRSAGIFIANRHVRWIQKIKREGSMILIHGNGKAYSRSKCFKRIRKALGERTWRCEESMS